MIVDGKQTRPIWLAKDNQTVKIIDQRHLPHAFVVVDLKTADDAVMAPCWQQTAMITFWHPLAAD